MTKVTILCKGRFHFYDLARELIRLGYDVNLITTLPKFVAKKYGIPSAHVTSLVFVELIERGWKYMPKFIKAKFNIQFFVLDFFGKQAAKKLKKCDILIAGSATALDAIYRARAIGIKVVILERGSTHILFQYEMLCSEYKKYGVNDHITHKKVIDKELIEYHIADYISVPSHFVGDTYLEYGIEKNKLLINPYGVNLDNFNNKHNKLIRQNLSTFTIIHCGTLSFRKGVHYLMKAFNELNLPNSRLLLIGSISDEFRKTYKKLKNDSTFHIGPFPQEILSNYYSKGSIFCLASLEEGLAMVIPQAMACGLPVICTYNTGGSEIVRNGIDGYLINARDVEQLKRCIQELYLDEKLRLNMSNNASQRVRDKFDWQSYGERADKLLSNLFKNFKQN